MEGHGRLKAELTLEQMNRERQKIEKAGMVIVPCGLRLDDNNCSVCIMCLCFSLEYFMCGVCVWVRVERE